MEGSKKKNINVMLRATENDFIRTEKIVVEALCYIIVSESSKDGVTIIPPAGIKHRICKIKSTRNEACCVSTFCEKGRHKQTSLVRNVQPLP